MRGIVAGLFGLLAGCAMAAPPQVVIEVVDLSCHRCAAFSAAADAIARDVRARGGVFRVAPVGPVTGDTPSSAVLAVYWTEAFAGDEQAQKVADALYDGYQAGAALDGPAGVSSWLAARGIDAGNMDLGDPSLRARFLRAVRMAASAGVSDLPAVMLVDPKTVSVTATLSWRGDTAELRARILRALEDVR